ncbi:MAG: D-glycero-beta-D-manno-heptose 1-phosphate adenylyltransferase [Crocinitomicaceae bacterium]
MKWLAQIRNKLIDNNSIDPFIHDLKNQGKKIVFTNGCFDILHKGHVEYLAQAADLGDVLIVGINSDASVRRQGKGEERPVNSLHARSTVLAALGCVDGVIEFDEETPAALIEQIVPDVLVKGGDYDPLQTDPSAKSYIVGKETVLKHGGTVKVIDLVKGYSTTNLVNKLKK